MAADPSEATTFAAEADARAFIAARLTARFREHPPLRAIDAGGAVAESLVERVEVDDRPPGPASLPALVPRFRWVIRTDDLKLFDAAADSLVKLFAAGLLVPVAPTAAAPAAILATLADVLKVVKRARAKGAFLEPQAFQLLTTLRTNGPMPFDSLALLLRAIDPAWTRDAVGAALDKLKAWPAADGTPLALVAVDGDTWRVIGI